MILVAALMCFVVFWLALFVDLLTFTFAKRGKLTPAGVLLALLFCLAGTLLVCWEVLQS